MLSPGDLQRAVNYRADQDAVEMVNAALYLRRPLLVTGKPGTGKSSLPFAVAHELNLGPVLRWTITSRSTLREGLYSYDAIGRLQDVNLSRREPAAEPDDPLATIGDYVRLGPLGTALLPFERPRVLLIDEIDKSDIDLPNDLLGLFEHPEYTIDELARVSDRIPDVSVLTADGDLRVGLHRGRVRCREFPFVVLTSNGEREFPPAFLRRCLRLDLRVPNRAQLADIVQSHLGPELADSGRDLLDAFMSRRGQGDLAADQLLNAIYLTHYAAREPGASRQRLAELLMPYLDRMG
jgi:MoxR-like ATPase